MIRLRPRRPDRRPPLRRTYQVRRVLRASRTFSELIRRGIGPLSAVGVLGVLFVTFKFVCPCPPLALFLLWKVLPPVTRSLREIEAMALLRICRSAIMTWARCQRLRDRVNSLVTVWLTGDPTQTVEQYLTFSRLARQFRVATFVIGVLHPRDRDALSHGLDEGFDRRCVDDAAIAALTEIRAGDGSIIHPDRAAALREMRWGCDGERVYCLAPLTHLPGGDDRVPDWHPACRPSVLWLGTGSLSDPLSLGRDLDRFQRTTHLSNAQFRRLPVRVVSAEVDPLVRSLLASRFSDVRFQVDPHAALKESGYRRSEAPVSSAPTAKPRQPENESIAAARREVAAWLSGTGGDRDPSGELDRAMATQAAPEPVLPVQDRSSEASVPVIPNFAAEGPPRPIFRSAAQEPEVLRINLGD